MNSDIISLGVLPQRDENVSRSVLQNSVRVRIVDVVNISESRQTQITDIQTRLDPRKGNIINQLDDDANETDSFRPKIETLYKYTVKDGAGNLAFLLPLSPIALNLGSVIEISSGSGVWRSVLVPETKQISVINPGMNLNARQRLARLQLDH